MKTSSAKSKGRRLQQLVRNRILSMFPALEPDDCKSCPMGSHGADVQLSPAARRLFPYSVECKARAKSTIQTDFDQSARNCPAGSTPIVVTKSDRREPLVTMTLTEFERLIGGQS